MSLMKLCEIFLNTSLFDKCGEYAFQDKRMFEIDLVCQFIYSRCFGMKFKSILNILNLFFDNFLKIQEK